MKSPDRDAADEMLRHLREDCGCMRSDEIADRLVKDASELATLRRRVDHEHQLFVQASGDYDRMSDLLENLFAMVQGECPTLLRDHHLFDEIKAALDDDAPLPPGRNEG